MPVVVTVPAGTGTAWVPAAPQSSPLLPDRAAVPSGCTPPCVVASARPQASSCFAGSPTESPIFFGFITLSANVDMRSIHTLHAPGPSGEFRAVCAGAVSTHRTYLGFFWTRNYYVLVTVRTVLLVLLKLEAVRTTPMRFLLPPHPRA